MEGTVPIHGRSWSVTQHTGTPEARIRVVRSCSSSKAIWANCASQAILLAPSGLVASTSARQPSPATSSSAYQPASRMAEANCSLSSRWAMVSPTREHAGAARSWAKNRSPLGETLA